MCVIKLNGEERKSWSIIAECTNALLVYSVITAYFCGGREAPVRVRELDDIDGNTHVT